MRRRPPSANRRAQSTVERLLAAPQWGITPIPMNANFIQNHSTTPYSSSTRMDTERRALAPIQTNSATSLLNKEKDKVKEDKEMQLSRRIVELERERADREVEWTSRLQDLMNELDATRRERDEAHICLETAQQEAEFARSEDVKQRERALAAEAREKEVQAQLDICEARLDASAKREIALETALRRATISSRH